MSDVLEKNRALVRRFVQAQANIDLDTLENLLTPDCVDQSLQPGQEITLLTLRRSGTRI